MSALQLESHDTQPWYRQFWPWFLIAVPMSAVIAGVWTLFIAIDSADGLVVDDYYKQGLAINRTLERDRMAQRLGLTAAIRFDTDKGQVHVLLRSAVAVPEQESMRLLILHPTIPDHDETIELQASGQGAFSGVLPALIPGDWHILIEPPQGEWRLTGRIQFPSPQEITLGAAG